MKARLRWTALALVAGGLLLPAGTLAGAAAAGPVTSVQRSVASPAPTQQAMPGTWSQQVDPFPSDQLTSVTCPDTASCLATARSSSLLARTVDGGAHWTVTNVAQGMATANTVSCPSVSRCYAIGTVAVMGGAVVLEVSTDFGLTWSPQVLPTGLTGSSDLTCPSVRSCFAATSGTWNIVSTSDGGSTWVGRSAPSAIGTITCSSGTTCFAFGTSDGSVAGTVDGITWSARTPLPVPAAYFASDASCPTPTFCVVVGAGTPAFPEIPPTPLLFVSSDGGASWQEPPFPTPAPGEQDRPGGGLSSVSCPTSTTCYVRGDDFGGSFGDATTDGAVTWTGQDPASGSPQEEAGVADTQSIACPAATDCFAVGSDIEHYQPTLPTPVVALAASPDHGGYWMAASDGTVFHYGSAGFFGSMSGQSLVSPIVGMAGTTDGKGYWLAAGDGGVFAFGDAAFLGSMGGSPLDRPVVGMAATSDGKGYWLVASDGGVFAFGDARFVGSMGGTSLTRPVVGMAADRATGGYWLAAADGGVFAFEAPFRGSAGGRPLSGSVSGVGSDPSGAGYWLVADDGGVFSFGVPFLGSMAGRPLGAPVDAIGVAGDAGYWLGASDGGVFAFGSARYEGSPSS